MVECDCVLHGRFHAVILKIPTEHVQISVRCSSALGKGYSEDIAGSNCHYEIMFMGNLTVYPDPFDPVSTLVTATRYREDCSATASLIRDRC